jgi:hypothetical protein
MIVDGLAVRHQKTTSPRQAAGLLTGFAGGGADLRAVAASPRLASAGALASAVRCASASSRVANTGIRAFRPVIRRAWPPAAAVR